MSALASTAQIPKTMATDTSVLLLNDVAGDGVRGVPESSALLVNGDMSRESIMRDEKRNL